MISTQVFPTCDANATFQALGISSEMNNTNPYLQFNSPHQFVSYGGLEAGMNPIEMGLKRSISAPVPIPETFIDSSSFPVCSLSVNLWFYYRRSFKKRHVTAITAATKRYRMVSILRSVFTLYMMKKI